MGGPRTFHCTCGADLATEAAFEAHSRDAHMGVQIQSWPLDEVQRWTDDDWRRFFAGDDA